MSMLQSLVAEVWHELRVFADLLEDLSVDTFLKALVERLFRLWGVSSISGHS